jgi:uncharacterized delta-60 repeat protein
LLVSAVAALVGGLGDRACGYVTLVRRAWFLALASLVLAVPAAAAPGDLDRTFSGDGWGRTYDVFGFSKGFFPKGAEDVAIQPDGKILAVSELQDARSHWWFGVYRWLPNGDLDRSFGSGGWVANDLGAFPRPHTVALQANGNILVGGQVECTNLELCFGIVRYRPNGSIDTSFGASGVARATFPGSRCGCEIDDIAVQRNGRIVAVGRRFRGGDAQDDLLLAVARFLPDGRLDPSFSRDGRLALDFGYGDDLGSAVAVQPDGKIVVGGVAAHRYRTEDDFLVARFRQNGTLDRTFSRDGVRIVNFVGRRYDDLYGLDLQPDGRIVAAGLSAVGHRREGPRFAILRLNRDGSLDRRFGKRLLKPGANGGYARSVLVDKSGGIIVGGLAFDDSKLDTAAWALIRYRSSGKLDRSFGRGGIVLSDFGTGADWVGSLAAQRDGKIVAVGEVYGDQAVARYVPR